MVKGILLMSVVVPQVTVWRGFDVSSHVSYAGFVPELEEVYRTHRIILVSDCFNGLGVLQSCGI